MNRIIFWITASLLLRGSAAYGQDLPISRVDMDHLTQMAAQISDEVQRAVRPDLVFEWNGFAGEGDSDYRAGTVAIAQHDYAGAVAAMQRAAAAKSHRSDAALYWKAYAELKLGHTQAALATLSQLRKLYPQSAWLNDAKALDLEARNQSGHPVSPETAGDDDLKLLALNGLMNSDPSRATPLIEKVVADPKNAPQLRERALFVLARSTAADARQTVANMAQGAANPDLQARAIQYLAVTRPKENGNLFENTYRRSPEPEVKRAVLHALFLSKDTNALLAIAKTEPDPDLQADAIHFLAMSGGTASLLPLYQSASNEALKRSVIDSLAAAGDSKDLVNIAQHEADPKMKHAAVERLSVMKDKTAADYMLELLGK